MMSQPMSVLTSRATVNWYTPPSYIEMARQVLGSIDLDPASNSLPQGWINATRWYSQEENGLTQRWAGRVWLNPPFNDTALWVRRLGHEYVHGDVTAAVLLVNSAHGYKWYEQLWTQRPICCASDRIRFVRENGTTGGQAKRGQTFAYFGKDVAKFKQVFSVIGRVILPED